MLNMFSDIHSLDKKMEQTQKMLDEHEAKFYNIFDYLNENNIVRLYERPDLKNDCLQYELFDDIYLRIDKGKKILKKFNDELEEMCFSLSYHYNYFVNKTNEKNKLYEEIQSLKKTNRYQLKPLYNIYEKNFFDYAEKYMKESSSGVSDDLEIINSWKKEESKIVKKVIDEVGTLNSIDVLVETEKSIDCIFKGNQGEQIGNLIVVSGEKRKPYFRMNFGGEL